MLYYHVHIIILTLPSGVQPVPYLPIPDQSLYLHFGIQDGAGPCGEIGAELAPNEHTHGIVNTERSAGQHKGKF